MTLRDLRSLQVGDEIYIIPKFMPNKTGGYAYDSTGKHSKMARFFGEIATVVLAGSEVVSLDIDGGFWNWFPEMIDFVPDNLIEISEDDIMF